MTGRAHCQRQVAFFAHRVFNSFKERNFRKKSFHNSNVKPVHQSTQRNWYMYHFLFESMHLVYVLSMLNVHGSQSWLLLVVLPSLCCDRYFYDELAAAGLMWSIPYQGWKLQKNSAFPSEKYWKDLPVHHCFFFSLSFGKVPKRLTCPQQFLPVSDRRTVSNFHPCLGHSHYILRSTSPPTCTNCLRQEKKQPSSF